MEHMPVLLEECITGLNIKPDGVYCDGTLGRCGHSREIARRLTTGRLIAIDRDSEAIEKAGTFLSGFEDKVILKKGNFGDICEILTELGIERVDGMLFDFGVASPQLDNPLRGMSYMRDGRLDMRLDMDGELTAFEVVNNWSEERLREILFGYGEEKYAGRIVRAIIKRRETKPVATTFELNDVILSAIPPSARRERQHPSKRTFQAIRIAVNDELGAIGRMLETAPDRLKKGGRLCSVSFQSLEDRLVKDAFNARVRGCTCPPDFPRCVCGFVQTLRLVTKKPVTPSEEEIRANPRARSAKLRIAERI